jgi:hypothetical protein
MSNRYQVRLDLTPETGRALERLSRITGKSVPKLTASFLDDAKDALHIMGDALEAANEVQGFARLQYLKGFEESTREMVEIASDAKTVLANIGSPSGRTPARRSR